LLVLGDMGEVGDQGPDLHVEVGEQVAHRGIEQLWCSGELMRHAARACPGARHFETVDALLAQLPQALTPAASVLVKGSRFMRMERVVQAVEAICKQPAKEHAC
jgi:UDP-N-acetylmuramyl pentapeptide synthase